MRDKYPGLYADYLENRTAAVILVHKLEDEVTRLREALQFVQEMAAEDIRIGQAAGCTWQIEANARAALGYDNESAGAE